MHVLAANGVELKRGSRVRIEGTAFWGMVTCITDEDGDMDDYGRMYGISPYVEVVFDDGVDDSFSTNKPYGGEYTCNDLVEA